MTHDPVKRLLGNLEATLQVYRQLLEIAQIKRRHIITHDAAQLQNDLRAEEKLLATAQELNGKRAELHADACAFVHADPGSNTLESLCPHLPKEVRAEFMGARVALRDVIDQLREANRTNVSLINNSIALVEGLIGALLNVEGANTYGPAGARPRAALPACSLDARA